MTKKGYIFLLILVGIIVFFNVLFNGFVWDDEEQILNNVAIHSITNFPNFFSGSTFNTGGSGSLGGLYYKPLMTTAFSIIYSLFGPSPFFFHFFQVTLHIINSIILFLVLRYLFKTSGKDLISFIISLIFLVHPINVEAVVYISDFQEVLFFFFGILAFWLIVSKRLTSFKKYFLLFLFMLSSLLSKESGLLFILIIALYTLIFSRNYLRNILITILTTVATYSFLRFIIAGIYFNKHGLTPISILPVQERLVSVPKIIVFYFKTFIYPVNLSISQHWIVKNLNTPDFFLPLLLCLLITIVFGLIFSFLKSKKSDYLKLYIFFIIWLVIGITLHLQIIFPLDMTVSDRWFYFPIIGLLGVLGVVFSQFKYNNRIKNIAFLSLGIIIILLSIRTINRNSNWKDGLTLYGHDVLVYNPAFDLENNYGVELFRANRFDEAEKHFAISTQVAPNWWTNWSNLGVIAERKNKIEEAKIYYQRAIDNGQYYLAYQNLAKIYLVYESPQKTVDFCEQSLKILPNNGSLWTVLSIAEYKLKQTDKSIIAIKNAYALEPNQQNSYIYSRLIQNLPLEVQ
ncbi:MAG: hypothetical protein PHQ59_03910 [Candidatus Daviesbacteria bacterium]|nr:hypothetical protein [Candidatus Daviesbacteria bacterium]